MPPFPAACAGCDEAADAGAVAAGVAGAVAAGVEAASVAGVAVAAVVEPAEDPPGLAELQPATVNPAAATAAATDMDMRNRMEPLPQLVTDVY